MYKATKTGSSVLAEIVPQKFLHEFFIYKESDKRETEQSSKDQRER